MGAKDERENQLPYLLASHSRLGKPAVKAKLVDETKPSKEAKPAETKLADEPQSKEQEKDATPTVESLTDEAKPSENSTGERRRMQPMGRIRSSMQHLLKKRSGLMMRSLRNLLKKLGFP